MWARYVIPLLFFALIRQLDIAALDYRHVPQVDELGYVATAEYVVKHGHISSEHNVLYRQFPGLSLLIAPVGLLLGNMTLAAHLVVLASAMLAIVLVQFLFGDFRLTFIFTFFFPYWITTASAVWSEAPVDVCFLLCIWAMRNARPWTIYFILGLLAGGFTVVIRQNVAFLIFPFIVIYALRRSHGNLVHTGGALALAMLPLLAYLSWNWLALHQLFPQFQLQHEEMMRQNHATPDPSHYSTRTLDFPFTGLIAGLTDRSHALGKSVSVLLALFLALAALPCLCVKSYREFESEDGMLATAFAASLACYLGFHLCIGGVSGYQFLDRYLSQANIIIEWALFYRRPLRWFWVTVSALFFVTFSLYTGMGTRSLGIIK